MKNIEGKLENYLNEAAKPIQEILFVSQGLHPSWDDSLEVLQLANQQILQPEGTFEGEHVLAFVGMHAKVAIVGKRNSIGFLITNLRVLTQPDFSVIAKSDSALISLFTQKQNPKELSSKLWNDFSVKMTLSMTQEQLSALKNALEGVINIVLPQLQELNYLPEDVQKSADISGRIKDLGLQNVLKTHAQNEKLFNKFAKKYNIKNILVGVADEPILFGSPFGLFITPTGITSREPMEECITSTWHEIKQHPATIGEKSDVIMAGQQIHFVPIFSEKSVPSIITLINELANKEILI